jgi:hypothetical protein
MHPANVRKLFKLLLAVLVTAGLTIAPLAAPAMAGHSMTAKMQMEDMSDMAADMPCCPDQQKNKGCQDCPLVAICMMSALPVKPFTGAALIRLPSHQRLHMFDDVIADGLARPPPDRPPRSLV